MGHAAAAAAEARGAGSRANACQPWRLHGGCMAAAWRLHGGSMAAAWRLCTEQRRWQAVWQAVRRLHGGCLCAGWRRA